MIQMLFNIKFYIRRKHKRANYSKRNYRKFHPPFLLNKQTAYILVVSRLAHFQLLYGTAHNIQFLFNKITIRNQSSRWGSCSRRGNLNFNYRIALLPPELADYIIVHELCHLGEFNHSEKFWNLVERTIPNWRELRARLKEHGLVDK
jgi:hypothetical protein